MDIISIIKKVNKKEESLDIQEAFNIYNLLRARYVSTQTIQLFKNFVHDVDWNIILDKYQLHFEKQINKLEELGTQDPGMDQVNGLERPLKQVEGEQEKIFCV